MEPTGTILFTTVGRPYYGFDIFSVQLPSKLDEHVSSAHWVSTEHRLTDGRSINFNGQFVDEDKTLVYISERTGSARIYLNRPGNAEPEQLHSPPESLFHDRPVIKNNRLYFISAHERPERPFRSWSALYSTRLDKNKVVRLTPYGSVDYSPAVSQSGKLIAVASYGARPWGGEFADLQTDVVVFPESDPMKRVLVCRHGGWPSWSGDSTIYFHRQSDDGWWSIYRVDLPENFASSDVSLAPIRVTPPGLHCFTPAAIHNSKRIVVATRRKGKNYRHIEIFDVKSQKFYPVTELLNANFHHYNPFVSPKSTFLGYHRFRGEGATGDSRIPRLETVISPIPGLRMLRLSGAFPAFSPSGELIAFNRDFDTYRGLQVVKSDGLKRWTLLKNRTAFYNSWSPTDNNVIFTAIGPIFQSVRANVQIARVTFDPARLSHDCDEIPVDIKILTKEGTGNNAFPSCSPDGKSVVFRSGRSGHNNLYIIDALHGEFEGGNGIRPLTEGPWIDTMPSWSPDGKLIAFSSNRHSPDNVDAFGIYVIKPDGSDVRRIKVADFEEERERLNHVCFSADGEWLLFTANLGGVTAEAVALPNHFQPYGDLYLVRLDGSGLQRLTWDGYENGTPAWHPKLLPGGSDGMDHVGVRLSSLSLRDENGEKLKGQFDEPLWIKCDF
ncbi:hypothetical protein CDL12_02705 [Handroanthus impetiginosus]|uniref:Uncharacterized protein n=1 Tax=Handroanthus impetiginosus TaxID=429701 RepID=A0A2G9I471_9LAMI|nr:hypothetical protein CDL12_02705 [Handroanthus impetiginosus]